MAQIREARNHEYLHQHIHLIGIGGTGLSAIARVLLARGYQVSGSDRELSPLAAQLAANGAVVRIGHAAENVQGADLVIRSSAIPDDNVEVVAALANHIPVLKRSDFLGRLMKDQVGIAVAGTHGKTTTSSMLAWVLSAAGQDPSFIVGGVVENLGVNAHSGDGPYFVIEADEYDRMFLGLSPKIAVVTNVEHDHPDCFPTAADFTQAFKDFADRVLPDGVLLVCGDDPGATDLMMYARTKGHRVLSYGIGAGNDFLAQHLDPVSGAGFEFDVQYQGEHQAQVRLDVPGVHNVLNALAVFAAAHLVGVSPTEIAQALAVFRGAGRRFEVQGVVGGITVIDDYAHHPTEIKATLAAARVQFPSQRLWVVWQPHTYSRTVTLWPAFIQAFGDADQVLVTDVYAARETAPQGFSIHTLAGEIKHANVQHISGLEVMSAHLLDVLSQNDVLLVLSAGDAVQISERVFTALQKRSTKKMVEEIVNQE